MREPFGRKFLQFQNRITTGLIGISTVACGDFLSRGVGMAAFLALLSIPLTSTVARADGMFFQFDASSESTTGVLAVEKDHLQYALRRSSWGGGYHWNGRVAWKLPLRNGKIPLTIRLGPTAQYNHDSTWDYGFSVVSESYNSTSWGGVFVLTDLSTIDSSYIILLQFAHRSGAALELSAAGNRDDYEEKAVTLSYRIGDSPYSLRLGRKFGAKETYFGLSINTF